MEKRYQVFISSTFTDLREERQAVLKSILELDHMPAGMELFPAVDDSAWQLITDVIDSSDYYVLIVGGRYGSLDESGISFTEKEYDYAVEQGLPVTALLHEKPDGLPRDRTEQDETAWERLRNFRAKVEANHTCRYWDSTNDLRAQIIVGLTAATKRSPREGWVRAGSVASQELTNELLKAKLKIEELQNALHATPELQVSNTDLLAQGEDKFEIEFRAVLKKKYGGWQDEDYQIRDVFVARPTWDQVFSAIAPNLTEPVKESVLRSSVNRLLKDGFDEEHGESVPDYLCDSVSISQTVADTIRIQLSALGLIESSFDSRETKGGPREYRFCFLIKSGREKLLQTNAIYRKDKMSSVSEEKTDTEQNNEAVT